MDQSDKKSGARNALTKYLERDIKEINKLNGLTKKRRNEKPEEEVAQACITWLKENGFIGERYESKAVNINGVWRQGGLKAGHSDWGGTCPLTSIGVFIEFKSPGRLSTFKKSGNERQRDFIISRIHAGCFSVVVDSLERLQELYNQWIKIRLLNPQEAKNYLLKMLP